jgi:hypothetical protein
VIQEEIVLSLDDAPSGRYRLAVGLYEASSKDRATIVTADGEIVPGDRLILADGIEVPAQ